MSAFRTVNGKHVIGNAFFIVMRTEYIENRDQNKTLSENFFQDYQYKIKYLSFRDDVALY